MIRPHIQFRLFLFALLLPGTFFLWRIWNILPLYTNSQTREAVRHALTTAAGREGWLLSDMLVIEATADKVRLMHRHHIRGIDPEACAMISLSDSALCACK